MKRFFGSLSLFILSLNFTVSWIVNAASEEELWNILNKFLYDTFTTVDENDNQVNNNAWFLDDIDELLTNNWQNLNNFSNWNLECNLSRIIWDRSNWTITVYSDDFNYWITLEDKNLWAENILNTGNYYKWGNNNPINTENYNNIESIKDNNAWWWWNDLDTSNPTVFRWYDLENHVATNVDLRQWPCNEWYHVPSAGEISELLRLYYNLKWMWNSISNRQWWSQIYDSSLNFISDLKIPRAGVIWYGMYFDKWNSFFQSSTKKSEYYWYHFYQTSTNIMSNWSSKDIDYWMPVRCFKNNYVPISEFRPYVRNVKYNPNWWSFDWKWVGEVIEKEYKYCWLEYDPIYDIQIPNRESSDVSVNSWWMFAGWFTKDWSNNDWWVEFDVNQSDSNIVYAKWLPFNDFNVSMWWVTFTIMDRNLWAESVAEGIFYDSNMWQEDNSKLWFLYQWWNNYWFNFGDSKYPNNYYYNNVFNIRNQRWDAENNNNLWWWINPLSVDLDKKWPCPLWYHVPTKDEWIKVYNLFNIEKSNNDYYCSWVYDKSWKCFANKLKLPYAWYAQSYDWMLSQVWYTARYWSSTPYVSDMSYYVLLNDDTLREQNSQSINEWISVRCFKDWPEIELNSNWWTIVNEKYFAYRWREDVSAIKDLPWKSSMDLTWYIFDWWFDNEDFSWNKILNNVIESNKKLIKLYAKRKPVPQYIYNWNWWVFKNWTWNKIVKSSFDQKKVTINNPNQNSVIENVVTLTWTDQLSVQLDSVIWCTNLINIYDYDRTKNQSWEKFKEIIIPNSVGRISEKFYVSWDTITIETIWSQYCPSQPYTWYISWKTLSIDVVDEIPNNPWYEFLWWYEENSDSPFDYKNTSITEDKTLYAHWKALEEKAQETTTENITYTNETTVTIWTEVQDETINNSSMINLVSKEVEQHEVKEEENKTTVQESEIQVTSDKTVEYQWWLEVYLEKTTNIGEEETKERIEWTAKFSSPVAVKIPITSNAETVKVQVKHEWEDFWYTWLTLNSYNECVNWEAVNNKYNWENIWVIEISWEKYALIYTCSASTFVAYTENEKPVVVNESTSTPTPSAWWGRIISTTTNKQPAIEPEHSSADVENKSIEQNTTTQTKEIVIDSKLQQRSLTRWEVAVMTNILLDVFPQLVEWKQELDDVENACSNYTDEQKFTKDEKKAITRLCKLSIMWIHADNNKPLDEFMVNQWTKDNEFSKVINRSLSNYNEKDFTVVKEALKKLEDNEENVEFWTVYNVFMSIKSLFN